MTRKLLWNREKIIRASKKKKKKEGGGGDNPSH